MTPGIAPVTSRTSCATSCTAPNPSAGTTPRPWHCSAPANALWQRGEYAEVERLDRQVLSDQERMLGPQHLRDLWGLSDQCGAPTLLWKVRRRVWRSTASPDRSR